MPEQTNIQRNPNGFDEYVRRLRSICDMHKVSFGSPGDLPGFMQSLTENSHFAMDFWALTGTVSSGRPGDLSSEQAVAAIIDGVAGGAIPEPDREQKGIVDDLSRLLAGVDIYNPEAQSADSGKRVGGRGPFSPPPPDRVPSSGAAGGGSDEPVSLGPASRLSWTRYVRGSSVLRGLPKNHRAGKPVARKIRGPSLNQTPHAANQTPRAAEILLRANRMIRRLSFGRKAILGGSDITSSQALLSWRLWRRAVSSPHVRDGTSCLRGRVAERVL